MDAPNAPNPTNPAAQDQFIDAVQGPAAQAQDQAQPAAQDQFIDAVQGPAAQAQDQAQGPANQVQGPAAQGPANNNAQVGQNVPVQPPHHQPPHNQFHWSLGACPSGILSKLDRKKPEFSGKPEEDAESHLLSTRDWMEAHNFPGKVKVRQFCLTLTGEARSWYESLASLDNDCPALQNKFKMAMFKNRQYSRTTVSCLEDI